MKGDHHAIKQDPDMTREINEDLAFMKKIRKEESGEDEENEDQPVKKEKSKGNFFLSDKGNQVRDNLER